MKTLLIALIIILLLIGYYGVNQIKETNKCSIYNFQNCNIACSEDSDCKNSYCKCVNVDEDVSNCHSEFFGFGKVCTSPNCAMFTCKCIENECRAI